MEKIFLVLENGRYFEGKSFGAKKGSVIGELVFTTSMTGYLETLSDPSYYGQIVVQTFPLIGNYGVIPSDFESKKLWPSGYAVREWCTNPSNFRCEGNIDELLKEKAIPAVCDIDTRCLTKIIREYGTMNGMITSKCPPYSEEEISRIKSFKISDAVKKVSRASFEEFKVCNPKRKISVWDFGNKHNIIRELNKRECDVVTVPYNFTAEEILKLKPDGILLSNGPGDPKENTDIIRELKKLCEKKIPVMGICLGHQLLALSQGAETEKLKYGHRGANHPAKDLKDDRVYITSQNHGYAVKNETIPKNAELRFINMNDGTCEGIDYTDIPAFSVQFHPEACGGPLDTEFLFDRFIELTDKYSIF